VLSHSTFGQYFRPQPNLLAVDPLRCVNLGSDTSPYYHGYGWLTSLLDQNTRVLTPVLNSSTHAGQWGLCPISGEELQRCNNIGALHVALLVDERLSNGFYALILPGKCLVAGFRALFYEGGGMVVGGMDGRTEDVARLSLVNGQLNDAAALVDGQPDENGDTASLPCATKLFHA
jgi:hypothetical protein